MRKDNGCLAISKIRGSTDRNGWLKQNSAAIGASRKVVCGNNPDCNLIFIAQTGATGPFDFIKDPKDTKAIDDKVAGLKLMCDKLVEAGADVAMFSQYIYAFAHVRNALNNLPVVDRFNEKHPQYP